MTEKILILDFGSQYTQLIARRLRELFVYCEIHPYNHIPELTSDIKGIILSGSPCSVNETDAPIIYGPPDSRGALRPRYAGKRVLITSGHADPIVPTDHPPHLARRYSGPVFQ